MEPELEKLLGQKRFDQLSHNEKQLVLDTMTEEEYERARVFLNLTRASFNEGYKKMNPDPKIKSRMKSAYNQHFTEKITKSTSKENKEIKKSALKPIWMYGPVAAFVILAAFLFFRLEDSGSVETDRPTTGMDIHQIENFELLKDQMSLKETGLYSKLIVPETYIETSLINSDTLLIP